MLFVGYLDVPKTGVYTFAFKNTNRSVMRLHQATIIDHDASFDAKKTIRRTVKLEKGLHPYRLYVNTDKGVRHNLSLKWVVPGNKVPTPIPQESLRVGMDGTVASFGKP